MADHVTCGYSDPHHPHTFDVIPFHNLGQPRAMVCGGETPIPKEDG